MKTWQWLLYGSVFIGGEYLAFQDYDRMTHATPKETFYGLPPEAVFVVPILLILFLHLLISLLGQTKIPASELEVPIAHVFVANPVSQEDFSQYNPIYNEVSDRFLFVVNAQRSYKQRHKGERIIAGFRFTQKMKQKFDEEMHYLYVRDDHLSHEEIAQYMIKEGGIDLDDYNYRISFSDYPQLIHTAEIAIYGMRGVPRSLEDLGIALYASGKGAQAESLLEAAKPEQMPRRK